MRRGHSETVRVRPALILLFIFYARKKYNAPYRKNIFERSVSDEGFVRQVFKLVRPRNDSGAQRSVCVLTKARSSIQSSSTLARTGPESEAK